MYIAISASNLSTEHSSEFPSGSVALNGQKLIWRKVRKLHQIRTSQTLQKYNGEIRYISLSHELRLDMCCAADYEGEYCLTAQPKFLPFCEYDAIISRCLQRGIINYYYYDDEIPGPLHAPKSNRNTRAALSVDLYAKLIITICIFAFSLPLIKYQGTEPGLGKANRSVKRKCPL